jgi:hypothetical protein
VRPSESFSFLQPPLSPSQAAGTGGGGTTVELDGQTQSSKSLRSDLSPIITFSSPTTANSNPFSDPTPSPATSGVSSSRFADQPPAKTETTAKLGSPIAYTTPILRPFTPTLHDEIAVSVGDVVRVSKVFDDGWVLVEKDPIEINGSQKGKKSVRQGLIPVDCLKDAEGALPGWLGEKMVV